MAVGYVEDFFPKQICATLWTLDLFVIYQRQSSFNIKIMGWFVFTEI